MNPEDIQRVKDLLPTSMDSEEIRATISAQILRRSVFSARMASAYYLERLRQVLVGYSSGTMNLADVRHSLLERLSEMGHAPADGGGVTNPASLKRIDLIVRTQRQMAAGAAAVLDQDEDSVYMAPAWELTRTIGKNVPRNDWAARWKAAGDAVGWEGAARTDVDLGGGEWSMVALKNSPIWQALGNGAGGFRDTLGNPFPPFAWGSGLGWLDVDRGRCIELGLISGDESARSLVPDRAGIAPGEDEVREAGRNYPWADWTEAGT